MAKKAATAPTAEQLAAITDNVNIKIGEQNAEMEGKKKEGLELKTLENEETETPGLIRCVRVSVGLRADRMRT